MSYGGYYGGSGSGLTETVRLAVESAGQGDVQQLIDLFAKLKATQGEIDDAYRQATAAAGQQAQAMKDQAKAGYEVIDSYDLVEEAIGRAKTAAEKEAAATLWMERQAKALSNTLEELAEHERTAEKATVDLAAAQGKASTASQQAADKGAGYSAMKWLLLSNAIQDVQYGLGAVTNNVAGLVQSFGGSAGLAGAAQIAAVALQVVISKAGAIRDFFGQSLPSNFKDSVEGLTKEVERLSKIKIEVMTRVDMLDLDIAKKKLDDLVATREAFDNLGKERPKDSLESAKRAKSAIVEYGGGDDFTNSRDRVIAAVRAGTPYVEGSNVLGQREKVAAAKKALDEATEPEVIQSRSYAVDQAEASLKTAIEADKVAFEKRIRDTVAKASEGFQAEILDVVRALKAAPKAMEANGVEEGILPALTGSLRANIATERVNKQVADTLDKIHKANEAEIVREIEASAAENADAVRKAVAATRGGIEERVTKQIFDALKGGATPEQASAGVRGMVLDYLRGRQVDGYALSGAADKIIEGSLGKAQNLADTGGQPKIDADRDKAVAEQAARVGPQFADAITRAMQRHMAQGEDSGQFAPNLARQLAGRLPGRNVPADLIDDVASKVVRDLATKAVNRESVDAKGVAGPYMDEAKRFLTENWARHEEMTRTNGAIARNRKESDRFTAMGVPHALSGPAAIEALTQAIGERMRAGGVDPRLADDVAQQAADQVGKDYGASMASAPSLAAGVMSFMVQEMGQGGGQQPGHGGRPHQAHPPRRPHPAPAPQPAAGHGFMSVAPEETPGPKAPAPADPGMQQVLGLVTQNGQQQGTILSVVQQAISQLTAESKRRDVQIAMLRSALQQHGMRIGDLQMKGPSLLPRW